MELKTKFNIEDDVYYIDTHNKEGITVGKYKIKGISVVKLLNGDCNLTYYIHHFTNPTIIHGVHENEIFSTDKIDDTLKYLLDMIKQKYE